MTDREITDLGSLAGRAVLVTSTTDRCGLPARLHGILEVSPTGNGARPRVELVVDCADVFDGTAARRSIPLDDHALVRLLASERDGRFEFAIPPSLD